MKAMVEGERVLRPYTPSSSPSQRGYVDLLVKTYEYGKMSQSLRKAKIGDTYEVGCLVAAIDCATHHIFSHIFCSPALLFACFAFIFRVRMPAALRCRCGAL